MDPAILICLVVALASIVVAILTVTLRDLVYSSGLLALLGSLTAALLALLGYYIVAVFTIIVYVGAAVMFIIITVSMLGGGGAELRSNTRGVVVALATLAALIAAISTLGLPAAIFRVSVDLRIVSDSLLSGYLMVLVVLLVALAATVIEGIAVARRG